LAKRWGLDRYIASTVRQSILDGTVTLHQLAPNASRPYYYLGQNRALTQLSNGLPFYVNTDDRGISPWIIMIGGWETFVDTVLMRLCQPGMRVCDLGANLGYYTIKLANIVGPSGYVLSLEPNPEIFPFLRDSIHLNGFGARVRAENLAAGSSEGLLTLTYADSNLGGGNLFGLPPHLSPRTSEVRVVAVDDLVGDEPGFDLIKVDIEGWEPTAFKGMARTLEKSAHASIVTEIAWGQWSASGNPIEEIRLLAGARDGLFIIHHDGSLERVPLENLERFRSVGVCYALLTHWTAETAGRIQDLVRA
jgi:FkbM family methyltransferase